MQLPPTRSLAPFTMRPAVPRLYLGTMTFGWSQTSSYVDETTAATMVERFLTSHPDNARIDTARIYAGGNTETIVGKVLAGMDKSKILLGTKAHPSQPGGLSPEGILGQLEASRQANQTKSFDEYYLHQPDTEHALLESLQCLNELVQQGVIAKIGMSNYHAHEVACAFGLSREHSWVAPTVYQGLYNPLNRLVEEELLPILRANQCSFVAYNPLAAGLLAGKHTDPDKVLKGRFQKNENYLPRFYTPANFAAVALVRQACEEEGISMIEATYRWLARHSALDANDGVLMGASSLGQLDENLKAWTAAAEKGPLPESILEAFDQGWELTKAGAFPYWRSYSADMPNRDSLDQGASYSAAKKLK